ncbi:hypothetical protein BT67DRAFT_394067 [Trichocladium antarcticum]|uniref:Mediator of RNA polymerase II transcription subunit 11 n=1 Tax=Trichocladium antarcticum TaxID=1450529 RepID=A0AAN6ZGR6_9PEZI|nr:hypothetical protein BT67DRAFT_394067 [Trichocladium antarcticum]
MNDPALPPAPNGSGATTDIHQPFTRAERLQQLNEVDNDIASLLQHLSTAMRALATPPGTSVAQPTRPPPSSPTPTSSDINMAALDSPAGGASSQNDPLTTFQTAQTAFFQTVDRIDKQLTRQVLALEEAGIVTLRSGAGASTAGDVLQQQGPQQQQLMETGGDGGGAKAAAAGARLEPDGAGKYGKLDVGRLNMASSKVERDMEGEMWRRGREHLEGAVGERGERMEE